MGLIFNLYSPFLVLAYPLLKGFSVALKPVLELALIDQAGLELTEICLLLPPEF